MMTSRSLAIGLTAAGALLLLSTRRATASTGGGGALAVPRLPTTTAAVDPLSALLRSLFPTLGGATPRVPASSTGGGFPSVGSSGGGGRAGGGASGPVQGPPDSAAYYGPPDDLAFVGPPEDVAYQGPPTDQADFGGIAQSPEGYDYLYGPGSTYANQGTDDAAFYSAQDWSFLDDLTAGGL